MWLDDFEFQNLNIMVSGTGMSREQVLRNLINGLEVRQAPPVEFGEILSELRRIGNNVNQLTNLANKYGFVDDRELEKTTRCLEQLEQTLCGFYKETD